MKQIILIILLVCICVLLFKNYKEHFNNKHYKDIYKTSLFDNKTIFIISNNPNLSKNTINFLKNYNFDKNTLVIRFNGNRTNKDLSTIKDDIMIFRHITNGNNIQSSDFHGLSKDNYNEKIHNVLLSENVDKDQFYYNNFFNKNNFINKNSSKLYFSVTNPIPKEYNIKKYTWGITSGVNTLISLLKTKYKKIYLIGFNLYGGKDTGYGHNFPYELEFINKITKENKNVKIML
jgi:hypothetical protein